jgi:hypothetical protein
MRYLRVTWAHAFSDEPAELFSEVGDDGYETRKVEVFRGGRMTYADEIRSTGSTILGETPIPSFEEIASQSEFAPEWISRDDFEAIWVTALGGP